MFVCLYVCVCISACVRLCRMFALKCAFLHEGVWVCVWPKTVVRQIWVSPAGSSVGSNVPPEGWKEEETEHAHSSTHTKHGHRGTASTARLLLPSLFPPTLTRISLSLSVSPCFILITPPFPNTPLSISISLCLLPDYSREMISGRIPECWNPGDYA